MIVLLAAGVGVCVVGLLAISIGMPISDSSFGNALLIAGVVVLCTGLILIGMWFVGRELSKLAKLVAAQGVDPARSVALARPFTPEDPFAASIDDRAADQHPGTDAVADHPGVPPSQPPWAREVAARGRPRSSSPEIPPIEPVEAPAPPAPDRPARRNLLFSTKRREKAEPLAPGSASPSALEAEPGVSFENAWPKPSNGYSDHTEPSIDPAEATGDEADAGRSAAESDAPARAQAATSDLSPGVTVVRSGSVDEMAYTYYSDGSIEAQLPGEGPIRFASLDALRTYVEQRK